MLDDAYLQRGLGHLFKYTYGFYGLMRHVPDGPLSQSCCDEAHRIF